jgi:hypothetical protein
MKARPIFPRNTYLTSGEFKTGFNYRCEKIDGDKLSDGDFWHGAIAWVWENDYFLDEIGTFKQFYAAAIVKGVLYPSVQFDSGYRFVPICFSNTPIEAKLCRNKPCDFFRNI